MDEKIKVVNLNINDILPNRFQPRIKFNEEALMDLADSIKEHGLIQPIIVRPISDKYEIIAGERRYKACVLADLKEIPAMILDINDKDSIEIALVENLQRKDLSPIEEAVSYKKTLDMGFITQEQLAVKLGKSQSSIANKIRLLNLCDDVQEALMEEKISERHARSLLKVKNSKDQKDLLERIIDERLTVRKLDEIIEKYKNSNAGLVEYDNVNEKDHDIINNNELNIIDNNKIKNDNADYIDLTNVSSIEDLDIVSDISNLLISEKDKKENGDNMNNMQNLNEQVNYNTVHVQNKTGGRFIGIDVDDESKNDNKTNFNIKEDHSTPSIFTSGKSTQQTNVADNSTSNIFGTNIFNNSQNSDVNNNISNNIGNNVIQPNIIVDEKPKDILMSENQLLSNNSTINNSTINNSEVTSSNLNSLPIEDSGTNLIGSQSSSSIFTNLMNTDINENDIVDKDTLNNFLDPTYIDGEKQEKEVNNSTIDDMVFSKFLDSDFGGETNINDNATPEITNNSQNNIFSNEVPNINTNSNIELNNLSENVNQPNYNNINIDNSITDLSDGTMENSPNLLDIESKPDLLAPMNSISNENFNESINNSYNNDSSALTESIDNNNDNISSFNDETNNLQENNETESNISDDSLSSQFFVTASIPKENITAPTTPILDIPNEPNNNQNIQINNEVSNVTDFQTEDNNSINTNEFGVSENPNNDNDTENNEKFNINENSGIEPIIITDYTKQYDPVLPENDVVKPKIELKEIINMVRNLSNQIESLGYVIDTDEIDLENNYQIIFNITKKN